MPPIRIPRPVDSQPAPAARPGDTIPSSSGALSSSWSPSRLSSSVGPHLVAVVDRARCFRVGRGDELEGIAALCFAVGRGLRSGLPIEMSLRQALDRDDGGPAAERVGRVVAEVESGRPLEHAVDDWIGDSTHWAERLVGQAIRFAVAGGGDLARCLDMAGLAIREHAAVELRRRTLTAQASASAFALVLLPLAFAAIASGLAGEPIHRGWAGVVLLGVGMVLDGLGLFWMRRMQGGLVIESADLLSATAVLQLAVAAGNPPRRAVELLCATPGAVANERLGLVARRLDLGAPLADALFHDVESLDPHLVRVFGVLERADLDGLEAATHLESLATDLGRAQIAALDVKAQQLSVKLLFPLVLCILPAFLCVSMIPLVLHVLRGLPL